MYEALSIARPGVPYVTILTDFADLPPHFWIEPRQAQYLVCGTGIVLFGGQGSKAMLGIARRLTLMPARAPRLVGLYPERPPALQRSRGAGAPS